MKKWLMLLVALMLLVWACPPAGAAGPGEGFSDVARSAWYAVCVEDVRERGLMNGVAVGRFDPSGDLTRAMLVTTLWRLAGTPAPREENRFSDVEAGAWYTDAVTWAAEQDVVLGVGEDRFSPSEPVTREQMAAIFYRWAERLGVTEAGAPGGTRSDPDVSGWAADAVDWALRQGLLVERLAEEAPFDVWMLEPRADASRAEVAVCLSRFCLEFTEEGERVPAVLEENGAATPAGSGDGLRRFSAWVAQDRMSATACRWSLTEESGDAAAFRPGPSSRAAYDARGRLIRWETPGVFGPVTHSVVYSAWGDPILWRIGDPTGAGGRFALYYREADGRSVLTACGPERHELTRLDGEKREREPLELTLVEKCLSLENPNHPDPAAGGGTRVTLDVTCPRIDGEGPWAAFNAFCAQAEQEAVRGVTGYRPSPGDDEAEYETVRDAFAVGHVERNDGGLLSVTRSVGGYGFSRDFRFAQGTFLAADLPELGLRAGDRLCLDTVFHAAWEDLYPVLAERLAAVSFDWSDGGYTAEDLKDMDRENFCVTEASLRLEMTSLRGERTQWPITADIPLLDLRERGFRLITETD